MAELSIQKRRSGTISGAERITGVKNAQSEMLLSRRLTQYQLKYKKTKLNIALDEYKLENEARMLRLDNKIHDLNYKKRIFPLSDLSPEEMAVQNLKKYLVQNVGNQCYLDKHMGYPTRNRTSPNYIPAVVSQARAVLRRKELMIEMQEAKQRMYSFLKQEDERHNSRQHGRNPFLTELEEDNTDDEEDDPDHKVMFPQILDIPASRERPITVHQEKTIHEKLRSNPVVRVAFENHKKQKELEEEAKAAASPTLILSRMSKRKPLTKTDMLEEVAKVQESVDEFNKKIEEVVWVYKEEEFQQGLRFVEDKDAEWNKFMEKMNKRTRASTAGDGIRPSEGSSSPRRVERRPVTSYVPRQSLTEKERKDLLMKNMLLDEKAQSESTNKKLPHRRGIPYHTAERMSRNSASAKLKRMTEDKEAAAVSDVNLPAVVAVTEAVVAS